MATSSKKSSAASAPEAFELPKLDDLSKFIAQFKLPDVDVSALLEWQRKDLDALAEANRQAFEGYVALIERRNEILGEALERWQHSLDGAVGAEALAKRSKSAAEGMEKTMEHVRELMAMEAETRTESWKVVQDRLRENMEHLKKLVQAK